MSDAKVRSIDSLESCRASIIVFLTKARRALDQVSDEIRRTRLWLQNDQRLHWENQIRRRTKLLEQAERELLAARLSAFRNTATMEEQMVRKAKRTLEEANDKLANVKKWDRDFDRAAELLNKKLGSIGHYLDHDMPKAIAYLSQAQRTLDAYAELSHPDANPPPPSTIPTEASQENAV